MLRASAVRPRGRVESFRGVRIIELGKPKDAKAALDLAARTEPENADLLQLRAKLK
jgi:hypothetical protein